LVYLKDLSIVYGNDFNSSKKLGAKTKFATKPKDGMVDRLLVFS
jgi:hypothetical protein